MSLATIMLEQLTVARRIVEDGHEVVPAWRIATSEGVFLILTPFDMDKIEQREKALFAISKFMAWKMATSFVLTTETRLGAQPTRQGGEALLGIGVSYQERLAALQRIRRGDAVGLGEVQWLQPYQIDDGYLKILPTESTEVTVEEAAELARMFGKYGELRAERLS